MVSPETIEKSNWMIRVTLDMAHHSAIVSRHKPLDFCNIHACYRVGGHRALRVVADCECCTYRRCQQTGEHHQSSSIRDSIQRGLVIYRGRSPSFYLYDPMPSKYRPSVQPVETVRFCYLGNLCKRASASDRDIMRSGSGLARIGWGEMKQATLTAVGFERYARRHGGRCFWLRWSGWFRGQRCAS
jgi:hypothetical protein